MYKKNPTSRNSNVNQSTAPGSSWSGASAPPTPPADAEAQASQLPAKVAASSVQESAAPTLVKSFDEMSLSEELLRGIYAYGFEKPSPIQQLAVAPFSSGRDLLAQAQSGTGKTATFSIGSLSRIDTTVNSVQAIILSNTRELAQQTCKVARALGDYMGARIHVCIGGAARADDERILSAGAASPHIVVGTPGRICDLIKRNTLRLTNLKVLVLDEADTLLSQGFQENLMSIFSKLPGSAQVCLFSATMPEQVTEIANQFLRNPVRILVNAEDVPLHGINQFHLELRTDDEKLAVITDLYDAVSVAQSIIFVNTVERAERLARELTSRDFAVSRIHGEMEQAERNVVMDTFRTGSSRVLIATDILARGIDVQQVSLVINFDIPFERENYIHRVGRCGRYGRKGVAINFIAPGKDSYKMDEIIQLFKIDVPALPQDFAALINN